MPRPADAPKPWTDEERAWARECLDAGDTVKEVASWALRSPRDVRSALKVTRADEIALRLKAGAVQRFGGADTC